MVLSIAFLLTLLSSGQALWLEACAFDEQKRPCFMSEVQCCRLEEAVRARVLLSAVKALKIRDEEHNQSLLDSSRSSALNSSRLSSYCQERRRIFDADSVLPLRLQSQTYFDEMIE